MIRHPDLSRTVYEQIKKMIDRGELAPGQKLKQEELALRLGVSRTPVLKALQSLEHEYMVESRPRRGMYVRALSLEEMVHVYECREGVELMAVRLAAERASDRALRSLDRIFARFTDTENISGERYREADEQFHNQLIELAGNPVLRRMSSVSDIHRRVYSYGLVRPPAETLEEHRRITAALIRRDPDAAEKEIRSHIRRSREKLMEELAKQQP